MSKLICVVGMNKDDEFPLREGSNLLGRSPEADIVLFDKKCSRRQCQIFKKGSYYAIEDLQSKHGTKVNGKDLSKRQSLKLGDKVQLGRTTLVLSDRAVGDIVSQTAADAAADLQGGRYDKLIGSAARDVVASHMHQETEEKRGLGTFLRSMFRKDK